MTATTATAVPITRPTGSVEMRDPEGRPQELSSTNVFSSRTNTGRPFFISRLRGHTAGEVYSSLYRSPGLTSGTGTNCTERPGTWLSRPTY